MATFYNKKNNSKTVLEFPLSVGTNQLTVQNASTFPTSGNFIITIWGKTKYPDPSDDPNMEILKVTSVSGNVFTVDRGQENTNDVRHGEYSALELLLTAAQIVELEDAINLVPPTANFIKHETPTPATDGAQLIFTTTNDYTSGTLEVFLDGLLQIKDTDYTETTSTTFTFTVAPDANEVLRVGYIKS